MVKQKCNHPFLLVSRGNYYTGPGKNIGKNNNPKKITKYYSCGMIQERRKGPWKPDQQKRGTGMEKTKEDEVK
jgi:hypothetical protein